MSTGIVEFQTRPGCHISVSYLNRVTKYWYILFLFHIRLGNPHNLAFLSTWILPVGLQPYYFDVCCSIPSTCSRTNWGRVWLTSSWSRSSGSWSYRVRLLLFLESTGRTGLRPRAPAPNFENRWLTTLNWEMCQYIGQSGLLRQSSGHSVLPRTLKFAYYEYAFAALDKNPTFPRSKWRSEPFPSSSPDDSSLEPPTVRTSDKDRITIDRCTRMTVQDDETPGESAPCTLLVVSRAWHECPRFTAV